LFIPEQLPLISVVFPSYNHEKYVEEAVRSIWEQSYPNIEIVVIDDASADSTPYILDNLSKISPMPMRVYRNETNKGPVVTVNRALKLSEGDFIALFASDDKFAPARFESQVRLFMNDPELLIVYGNGCTFPERGPGSRLHREKARQILSMDTGDILDYLYTNTSPFFLQTALIRRSLIMEVGGLDESLAADDWVLNIRIFRELLRSGAHFAYIDEDLAYYRVHEGNVHKDFKRQSKLKIEVIEHLTPVHLKKEAFANIYWSIGWTILKKQDDFKQGFDYLIKSQKNRFNLNRLIKLCWFIITGPFRAILTRGKIKNLV
jgi:alpha-1,3-rhamnosyltransferase